MDDHSEILKSLGSEFRRVRKTRGKTLSELSKATGISRVYIGRFERGLSNLSIVNLMKISNELKTPLSELFSSVEI